MSSRRIRRALLAGCVAFIAVTVVASDGRQPEVSATPGQADRVSFARVDEVASALACQQLRVLEDDVHFYDAMRGFDCWRGGTELLSFRAYRRDSSTAQVLQDWDGIIGVGRMLLTGDNWFAVGTEPDLREVSAILGVADLPTTDLPSFARPLSRSEVGIGVCGTAVATFVERAAVQGQELDMEELRSHEAVFPGITRAIRAVLDRIGDTEVTSDEFSYVISEHGAWVKAACERSVDRRQ